MTQPAAELWQQLEATNDLPSGLAKVTAIEALINRADAEQLPDLQFATRMHASNAYQYGGEPAKAFVSFSWCLAAHDRGDGVDRYTHDLFWHFKWMVFALTMFPEVPLDRTYAVLDDMRRRYQLAGHGMNPVHQYRNAVAMHVGDVETADEEYRLWLAAPRTNMSDCVACEPTFKVDYLAWRGRDEEASEIGTAVLSGRLTCIEQPQSVLSTLLLPYLRTGRLDDAARAHRNAYRAIQANRADMGMVANHLRFCAVSGNHARGLQLVERHLDWLRQPPTPLYDMEFAAASAGVLNKVIEAGHADATVRRTGDDEITVAALRDELTGRATALAARFDARNGTNEQGRAVAATLAAEQLVDYLPLSGPIRKARSAALPIARSAPPTTYPTNPDHLIERAEHLTSLYETAEAAAIWAQFDATCPNPTSAQLARRLIASAADQSDSDPAQAEATWLHAAELFASAGMEAWSQAVQGRIAFMWAATGRLDEAVAKAQAVAARINDIGTDLQRARSSFRLAGTFGVAGRLDDMATALAEAARFAERTDDRALQATIGLQQANVLANQGREGFDQAMALAERSVARYGAYGPSAALRQAELQLGNMRMYIGNAEGAEAALAKAALATDPHLRGEANRLRGKLALNNGQDEGAYDLLSSAIADLLDPAIPSRTTGSEDIPAPPVVPSRSTGSEGTPAPPTVPYARVDLAAAALNLAKPEEAAESIEDALTDLIRTGDTEETARARFLLAKSYRALDQPDQALNLLTEVEQHCVAAQNWAGVGQMRAMAADILDREDRDAEAAERFASAATAYRDAGMALDELTNLRRSSLSWHWSGDNPKSLAALAVADDAAVRLSADQPPVIWQTALLNYDASRILSNTNKPEEALPRVEAARAGFAALDAGEEITIAEVLQGRILIDLNRTNEAETLLRTALSALPATAQQRRQQVSALLDSIQT